MKNRRNICFLIILLFIPFVAVAQNDCHPLLDIDVKFTAKQRGTEIDSKYQFPYFKETDILRIDNIKLINQANCTLSNAVLLLKVKPQNGYTPVDMHPSNYGDITFSLPQLTPKTIIEINRTVSNNYTYLTNHQLNYTGWNRRGGC